MVSVFFFLCFYYFPFSFLEEKLSFVQNESLVVDKHLDSMDSSYLGILEIPSISLKSKFYNESSLFNDVNKNIYFVPGSTMSQEEYSNLILAAHSGFSQVAYFKKLYKLSNYDIANIYYEGNKYTYQLVSVYQEEKDGTITIHREKYKSHLTLVTCDKKNRNLQDVYVFELISVE